MDKSFNWDINDFSTLEKALKQWFNVFYWDISIRNKYLTSLASLSKFSYTVNWLFDCSNNNLTSLEWCPNVVQNFDCWDNKLTTLEWCPQIVSWYFLCHNNKLTTLNGCPKNIEWPFRCFCNQLTTLEWWPIFVKWSVYCEKNKFIPVEKKKWNIFKLWESIYIWTPDNKDIQVLIKCSISQNSESQMYYNSFNNFIKSTVKLDKKDITNTDISFNGKKYKRNLLNV
jgi:hypothetical protein